MTLNQRIVLYTLGGLSLIGGLSILGPLGCKSDVSQAQSYAPYTGPPPYPNKRSPLTLGRGPIAMVSNSGDDTISFIDLTRDELISTRAVGRNPVDIDGPHHLAADRSDGLVFTALSYPPNASASTGPHAGHGIGTKPGLVRALSLVDGKPIFEYSVDASPGDIVLSPDKTHLVVSHFDLVLAANTRLAFAARRATLMVANLLHDAPFYQGLVRTTMCVAPHGITFAAGDSTRIYVACYGEDAIGSYTLGAPAASVIRTPVADGVVEGTVTFGPYAVTPNPAGDLLVASELEARDVRFFRLPSLERAGAVGVGGAAYFPSFSKDGRTLLVPTQGPDALVRIDVTTHAITATRRFAVTECQRPHEALLSTDETKVYVVCEGEHTAPSVVLVVDAITFATQKVIPVGVCPDRFFRSESAGAVEP